MDNSEVNVKCVLHVGLSVLFLRLCMKLPDAVLRLVEPKVAMPGWSWGGDEALHCPAILSDKETR
jgi:hypothetical protein